MGAMRAAMALGRCSVRPHSALLNARPTCTRLSRSIRASTFQLQFYRGIFSFKKSRKKLSISRAPVVILIGTLLIYSLYPADDFRRLKSEAKKARKQPRSSGGDGSPDAERQPAWFSFARRFENLSIATDIEWGKLSDKLVGYIVPDWSKLIPGYVRKLQRELSMAPGSLADEIWREAHDPLINPEIQWSARVRVSSELCDEEKEFLVRRRKVATVALARYLGLDEDDIHPEDVPVIAMCGSGGGLRALVAGAGSLLATAEDGLFDCVTYTSGVSGSCWLQALYYSSITECNLARTIDHLKARLGVHIAYPPVAFTSLVTAPTNKYLLNGMVEKLKGDPKADFGLVDVYGLLLGARLLVPKGELGVNARDFKLSNQQDYIKFGQNPLPIYTAVRHEIPVLEPNASEDTGPSEAAKEKAKREAWFQWFEITPYECFLEECAAGIPTWAIGRKFRDGAAVPLEDGFHLPEIRMTLLLGIFGSAFCATLNHYYREIRPIVQGLSGFAAVDEMVSGRSEDLSKVHPIDPASIPNFAFAMDGKLARTTPRSVYTSEYLQLMDAGMSNNLPIYPLLRPGRGVEIVIAFDASADIRTDNWLSVADGYARQRGIKGWPVGIGWPKPTDSREKTAAQLEEAQAASAAEAETKLEDAKADQAVRRREAAAGGGIESGPAKQGKSENNTDKYEAGDEEAGELGYCTVWVGTAHERLSASEPPPPKEGGGGGGGDQSRSAAVAEAKAKAIDDSSAWQLMEPDAGIAVVYLPFLTNERVPGVDPARDDYMNTFNFVYTPEQIDGVVALARANYDESKDRIRRTVRAVYERKRRLREEREERAQREQFRRMVRLGIVDKLGEGDHFS